MTNQLDALTRENPRSRWHTEETRTGRSSWACVPLTDAVEAANPFIDKAGDGRCYERPLGLCDVHPGGRFVDNGRQCSVVRPVIDKAGEPPCVCEPFFSGHVFQHPDCPRGRAEILSQPPALDVSLVAEALFEARIGAPQDAATLAEMLTPVLLRLIAPASDTEPSNGG